MKSDPTPPLAPRPRRTPGLEDQLWNSAVLRQPSRQAIGKAGKNKRQQDTHDMPSDIPHNFFDKDNSSTTRTHPRGVHALILNGPQAYHFAPPAIDDTERLRLIAIAAHSSKSLCLRTRSLSRTPHAETVRDSLPDVLKHRLTHCYAACYTHGHRGITRGERVSQ